ncbi:MAG: AGE family epimerase/isomerase [Balneolaceae bacterium]
MDKSARKKLLKLSAELREELVSGILPYWINNAVDDGKGGFYGRITFNNQVIPDADKSSLLTARVLWTFSACYREFGDPEYKRIAKHAYDFLTGACWDQEFGGIYWMTDAEGKVTDSRKYVYAQAFAIYALSEYYGATENSEALGLAKELYSLLETKCVDPVNSGYFEAFSNNWKILDDVRLSEKDKNEPKSMNTHLHMLEAYTNLYRYWRSVDLKNSLRLLVDIFADHIIDEKNMAATTFFAEDWTPKSGEFSYGHDIETSWLLLEAAEVLGDYPRKEKLRNISLGFAKHVKKEGIDKDGGVFNEGSPEGLTDENKDWWPQAEGVVGFLNAYQLLGEEDYLKAAYNIWEFIKTKVIDSQHGEWHEKVNRKGAPYELDKVRSWKCPYHNGRAALEVMHRVELLTGDNYNSKHSVLKRSVFQNSHQK